MGKRRDRNRPFLTPKMYIFLFTINNNNTDSDGKIWRIHSMHSGFGFLASLYCSLSETALSFFWVDCSGL